jgi:predicted ATPase
MFLNSLTERQLSKLSTWIESLFGYGLTVIRSEGHISIALSDGFRNSNLVDVGYGLSQILPVLAQIWWARERPNSRASSAMPKGPSILAIEQPELHLHPAHQALLANAIAGAALAQTSANSRKRVIHFLVETHSETMINRFGELIAAGSVNPEDIQVILFEPDHGELHTTSISISEFDKNGALLNWPYGFFQPAEI